MPSSCAVRGCKSYLIAPSKKIRFFTFPKDPVLKKIWTDACGSLKAQKKSAVICSLHFTENDWHLKHRLLNTAMEKRTLAPDAVPTVNLPGHSAKTTLTAGTSIRALAPVSISSDALMSAFQECTQKTNIETHSKNESKNEASEIRPSVEVQTDVDLECARDLKILKMEKERSNVLKQITEMKAEINKLKVLESSLSNIFTPNQIKILRKPNKKITWDPEDISSALCLNSASPKAYCYLYNKKFPLPGPSTLRQWTTKIRLAPGILDHVLEYMKNNPLEEIDRICILSLGEMKIKPEHGNDTNHEPLNCVQVGMVRGILSSWKHPIFYNYNSKMTESILKNIIVCLDKVGYTVVSIVSDIRGSNQCLWKDIGVSIEKTWFKNPAQENKKIFVFADVPHLLRLLRNHFLDTGFTLNDKEINVEPIKELLNIKSSSDSNIPYKITENHLSLKYAARQNVLLAAQLFSHSTFSDLRSCVSLGRIASKNALACSDFIKLVNDWFDIFNCETSDTDSREETKAYGLALEVQSEIINNMNEMIVKLRIPSKKVMLPFQRGILISNSSLTEVLTYLKENYNIQSIRTERLNLDGLENFLSDIRTKVGDFHPTGLEFKYRLKSYLLDNL